MISEPTSSEIRLIIAEAAEGQDTPDINSGVQMDAWREAHAEPEAG